MVFEKYWAYPLALDTYRWPLDEPTPYLPLTVLAAASGSVGGKDG